MEKIVVKLDPVLKMKKFCFLHFLFIFALLCLVRSEASDETRAGEQEKRMSNLIYILADDLGYVDLGCYGQTALKTPHLDRMAAESVRFTCHYAGSTVCAPSRCVLMTGLHTGHACIRGNSPSWLTAEDFTVGHFFAGSRLQNWLFWQMGRRQSTAFG